MNPYEVRKYVIAFVPQKPQVCSYEYHTPTGGGMLSVRHVGYSTELSNYVSLHHASPDMELDVLDRDVVEKLYEFSKELSDGHIRKAAGVMIEALHAFLQTVHSDESRKALADEFGLQFASYFHNQFHEERSYVSPYVAAHEVATSLQEMHIFKDVNVMDEEVVIYSAIRHSGDRDEVAPELSFVDNQTRYLSEVDCPTHKPLPPLT